MREVGHWLSWSTSSMPDFEGKHRWVPTTRTQRRSRNEVIECAWRHGALVRYPA
jgi:hypothetical protein